MTKYICTSCETTFEHDAGKLRCPQCLRQHGLVEEGAQKPQKERRPGGRRRTVVLALLGVSVAGLAAGGGLLYHRSRTDLPGPGQLAVLDADMLRKTLLKRGVPLEQVVDPLTPGPQVKALAATVTEADPTKRALALARKVSARVKGYTADFGGVGPGATVRTPEELLAVKAEQKPGVLSYELATLLVAVLRAAGLQAVLAQVHRVNAPMPSADPRGAAGRYVAVVYAAGGLGRQVLTTLDPLRALKLPRWAGEGGDAAMTVPAGAAAEPLDDASAAARLLSLRALRSPGEKSREAYTLSSLAIKASAPSATLHVARAMVLAAAGGRKDALAEARKALSLRKDPPRHTTVAMLSLSQGKLDEALLNLKEALRQDANFWPARQLMAMVTKPEEADKHMKAALEVAPEEPSVQLTHAARLMAARKAKEAIAVLRKVVAARPDREALLMLYQALVVTGQKEEATAVRARLLASVAKGKERKALLRLLGAMTPPSETPAAGAAPPAAPRIPKLELPDVTLGK